MATRFAVTATALIALVFAGGTAHAQSKRKTSTKKIKKTKKVVKKKSDLAKRVDTHLRRGIEFYAEKQYELAIVEFRAGFALDPRRDFLFALAQAERLSGDCPTAVIYYKRFVQTNPSDHQREAARVNMKRCGRALESGPSGRPAKPTEAALRDAEGAKNVPPAMPVGVVANDDRSSRPPWYKDTIGSSLLVAGVVSLGIGSGFWFASNSAESAADDAGNLDDFRAHMDRASSRRTISVASLAVAAGLISVGVWRLATRKRGSRNRSLKTQSTRSLVAAPAPNGVVVGVIGRF